MIVPPDLDRKYAALLKAECSTRDREGDGCRADQILGDLLRAIGATETADAYEALDLLRA